MNNLNGSFRYIAFYLAKRGAILPSYPSAEMEKTEFWEEYMDRRQFLKGSAAAGALAIGFRHMPARAANDPFVKLDALGQAALVKKKEVTPLELVDAAIARIERLDGKVNAVVTETFEAAREEAKAGAGEGAFAGVPYLLKDLNDLKGVRRTSGSKMLADYVSDWQSPYTDKTLETGLVVLGKSNTPEFGLLATTEPLLLGACHNPWDLEHSTGGSSGGSAAATAAGMVPFAQSSDGGGSIRIPASCCGLFGLKPSRGRMLEQNKDPMPGDISVKHVISRSVRDSAALLDLTEVKEGGAFAPTGNVTDAGTKRLKIAFSMARYDGSDPDGDVRKAIEETAELCKGLGHEIVDVTPPIDGPQFIDHFLTAWASGPAQLKALVEEKTGKPAAETGLLEPWTLGLADFFNAKDDDAMKNALAYFAKVEADIAEFFTGYDVWLTPTLASAPPKLGEQAPTVDFDTLYERTTTYVAYTPQHNVAGTPAMSVPLSWNEAGLPIGSQFAAAKGQEGLLLQLAYELEKAQPWMDKWAPYSAVNV